MLRSRQGANLSKNASVVGEFGNLSGSIINVALFLKSQISSGVCLAWLCFSCNNAHSTAKLTRGVLFAGKSVEFLTLSDGVGGFYQTTRIGLALSSIAYIVKYNARGTKIIATGLPLAQDSKLLTAFNRYTSPSNGSGGMGEFASALLIVSELVDEFSLGEKPSEYAVLFGQINSITAAEGAIGGTTGFSGPIIMKWCALPCV